MKKPLVSVIVPTFNAEKTINDTLVSILNQTYQKIEIIIIDDCSTDSTVSIVGKYLATDAKINIISTVRQTGGPAQPRNIGILQSQGEWVAFCDSDDIWHPKKIEVQISAAVKYEANMVSSNICVISKSEMVVDFYSISKEVEFNRVSRNQMLIKNQIATSSVIVDKKILVAVGGFNSDKEMVAVEDYDLWLRCTSIPGIKIIQISLPLIYYRASNDSISSNKILMYPKVLRVLFKNIKMSHAIIRAFGAFFLSFGYVALSVFDRIIRRPKKRLQCKDKIVAKVALK